MLTRTRFPVRKTPRSQVTPHPEYVITGSGERTRMQPSSRCRRVRWCVWPVKRGRGPGGHPTDANPPPGLPPTQRCTDPAPASAVAAPTSPCPASLPRISTACGSASARGCGCPRRGSRGSQRSRRTNRAWIGIVALVRLLGLASSVCCGWGGSSSDALLVATPTCPVTSRGSTPLEAACLFVTQNRKRIVLLHDHE